MSRLNRVYALITVWSLSLTFLFPSWGTGALSAPPVSPPPSAPAEPSPEEMSEFQAGVNRIHKGELEEGVTQLERLLLNHPESPILPDILVELGQALLQKGDLKAAVNAFTFFLEKFPQDVRGPTVRFKLGVAYLSIGGEEGLHNALEVWNGVAGQEELKIATYDRVAEAYTERGEYLNTLRVLMQKRGLVSDHQQIDPAVLSIIGNRLSEKELQSVVSAFRPNFPTSDAMVRLIDLYDEKEIYYRQEKEIEQFLALFPDHPYTAEAKNKRLAMRDKIKENRYLIAVLLPLSGKLSPFGVHALNGIDLAMRQFKEAVPDASVGLVVQDYGDEQGKAAFGEWLRDYQPLGIIGPLLSRDVSQVASVAEKGGYAVITPGASAAELPLMGKTVFRNAMTTRSQCHAIAEYAALTLNLKRFALLFPNERSGTEWAKCLSEKVTALGGKLVASESYPINETDFKEPILRLKKGKKSGPEGAGFDALFLPGEAKTVGLIIPQLVFYDIKDTVLLGSTGWNNPDFFKFSGLHAEGAVFVDGFYLESPDPMVEHFVSQYRGQFQQDPNLFAAQAYDATRLFLDAFQKGARTRQEVRASIAATKNFPAVSGHIFEMRDGEAIKKPFFIQIKKGKGVQIN